jgi:hypothetical protein
MTNEDHVGRRLEQGDLRLVLVAGHGSVARGFAGKIHGYLFVGEPDGPVRIEVEGRFDHRNDNRAQFFVGDEDWLKGESRAVLDFWVAQARSNSGRQAAQTTTAR